MVARVIVAGGFGVLGRAVTDHLVGQGDRVAAVDVATAPDGCRATLAIGGIDLADDAAVAAAYAEAERMLGGVDGLVNVAGGFVWETLASGSIDTWDAMYRINLRTTVVSSRAVLAHLADGGAIVNVGAAAASNAVVGMAPYAASKAGVVALTQSLADELRPRDIRVNAVLPTIIDTPANRRDMPGADTSGWVRPEAAAAAIAYLLAPASGAITGVGIPLSLPGRG